MEKGLRQFSFSDVFRTFRNLGSCLPFRKLEGIKLFAGDFRPNLDETNDDMVQFTKRWNWKWMV